LIAAVVTFFFSIGLCNNPVWLSIDAYDVWSSPPLLVIFACARVFVFFSWSGGSPVLAVCLCTTHSPQSIRKYKTKPWKDGSRNHWRNLSPVGLAPKEHTRAFFNILVGCRQGIIFPIALLHILVLFSFFK
jgi:hypothetical protein